MSGAVAVRIGGGGPADGRSGRDGQSSGRAPSRPPLRLPAEAGGPSPPRPILLAAGAFALLTIVGAGVARWTGAGHIEPPRSAVVAARDLWFDDEPAGAVRVRTRTAGGADSEVATLRAGEGMFVRGALRALARGRRLSAEGGGAPADVSRAAFRLTRYADGRLTLDDPTTGAHLELRAFGPVNQAAFAGLLPPAR